MESCCRKSRSRNFNGDRRLDKETFSNIRVTIPKSLDYAIDQRACRSSTCRVWRKTRLKRLPSLEQTQASAGTLRREIADFDQAFRPRSTG
jgi:hypothetical protein